MCHKSKHIHSIYAFNVRIIFKCKLRGAAGGGQESSSIWSIKIWNTLIECFWINWVQFTFNNSFYFSETQPPYNLKNTLALIWSFLFNRSNFSSNYELIMIWLSVSYISLLIEQSYKTTGALNCSHPYDYWMHQNEWVVWEDYYFPLKFTVSYISADSRSCMWSVKWGGGSYSFIIGIN